MTRPRLSHVVAATITTVLLPMVGASAGAVEAPTPNQPQSLRAVEGALLAISAAITLDRFYDGLTAAASTTALTRTRRSVHRGPSTGGVADASTLACIRAHESDTAGGYHASNGTHFGAYQFAQSTWNATARHAGRLDLVGVRPDHATPADQDAMAMALLTWPGAGGIRHWTDGQRRCG